jgi:hypothetical protein
MCTAQKLTSQLLIVVVAAERVPGIDVGCGLEPANAI